jgi:hypothetical protein
MCLEESRGWWSGSCGNKHEALSLNPSAAKKYSHTYIHRKILIMHQNLEVAENVM